ncbi:MAG: hypothetical protein HQ567_35200 [Candidatus Nealsonbacteria bacterium]|nr:hypothetical protein [Candidatus Nealsonbacteria bacterium]
MKKKLGQESSAVTRPIVTRVALLIPMVVCIQPALAADQNHDETKIVVSEHLGLTWTDEVVTYPFSAGKGRCTATSVKLLGPLGPQPCQLSEVMLWPGTEFVKSAKLSFVVAKLEPQTTQSYTLSSSPTPAAQKAKTDLAISTKAGRAEATTAKCGVRLLVGQKSYDPAAAAAKVPAPVLNMRLADGTWFGGSRMFGPTPIKSYTARMIDSGPVFVRAHCVYTYANGNTLDVLTRLDAGGQGLVFETEVAQQKLDDGWDLRLTPGLPALTLQFPKEAAGKQSAAEGIEKSNWLERPVGAYATGTLTKLSPWGDWWNEFTQPDVYLQFADGQRELALVRRSPQRWVLPVEGGEAPFGHYEKKAIPLIKQTDGTVALRVNNASGIRVWSVSEGDNPQKKFERYSQLKGPASGPPLGLNAVKDMVLDWPDVAKKHPWLIMNATEMSRAAKATPDALSRLASVHAVKTMEELLSRMGEFDLMRKVGNLAGQYDAIIDSDLITPLQRKLLRARMAYLAYYAASPANWSPERGYRSGNPNMTIAHTLNQGVLACLLSDHPMARQWAEGPTQRMQDWLDKTVDDDGYWNESSHYARVSISKLMFYAIAAQRAGFGDFLSDPKFKKMGMLYERLLTPPDPQRELSVRAAQGQPKTNESGLYPRVSAPHGRGERGDRWGLGGLLAKAQLQLDPEYSAIMQWSWKKTGMTYVMGEGMGGQERLYSDPNLPARTPHWRSEFIRRLGYLLRSGTGSDTESFLLFISQFATNPDGEIWPSETGAISKWFARGVPISGEFNGYPYSNLHSMLLNRVMPAASYKPGSTAPPTGFTGQASQGGFVALPRLDYASAGFELTGAWSRVFSIPDAAPAFPPTPKTGGLPMTWQRQLMSVKDDEADGISYIVLRDTVGGERPTQWHFWTLSEKIGTPAEAANRTKFLADAPGEKILGPRALKGDRFTAMGQFGMDLEYYVASPASTPRHTVRYGLRPSAADVPSFSEYQDLLQLTLPGDGAYYVAMFPHKPNEKVPSFATSADGRVITISSDWGTDYAFLSKDPATAKVAGFSFQGTAASIQNRGSGLVLALGGQGTVTTESVVLTAPFGVSLRVGSAALTIDLPADHPAGEIVLVAPGAWKLREHRDVTLTKEPAGSYKLGIPAGRTVVELIKAD